MNDMKNKTKTIKDDLSIIESLSTKRNNIIIVIIFCFYKANFYKVKIGLILFRKQDHIHIDVSNENSMDVYRYVIFKSSIFLFYLLK